MPLPKSLAKRLRLPAIAAPMFLTSGGGQGSRGKRVDGELYWGGEHLSALRERLGRGADA